MASARMASAISVQPTMNSWRRLCHPRASSGVRRRHSTRRNHPATAAADVMSTWERPAHLALALAGYLRQQGGVPFELLVADDGSGPETAEVVRRFAARAPFPVQHVWHPRDGHRRTAILNLAVARARGEQVLYTDGDCVPAADLIAVHRRELEPSKLLIGGYVRVRPEIGDRATYPFRVAHRKAAFSTWT